MFLIADQIYEEGFDVYKFDEEQVGAGFLGSPGEGLAYDTVREAINTRFISNVSILGYSQGGGSTYNLSWWLDQQRQVSEVGPYNLSFTAYVDAVDDASPTGNAEERLPINTQWHLNLYQQDDDVLDGVPTIGANENTNVEESPLFPFNEISHTDIDEHPSVIAWVLMRFRQNVNQ